MRFPLLLAAVSVLLFGCGQQESSAPKPSGAWSSLQWMNGVRAYPAQDIPGAGFSQAFAEKRGARKADMDALEPWEPRGPHNVAGRMLTVAFNPENTRTLWAGSASGGLWRSWSAGEGTAAWHRVETGFPLLSVSALAFAPGDSSTIYIGTGEVYNYGQGDGRGVTHRPTRGSYGTGILVSRDGGQSWSRSLDWEAEQGRGVQMLRVNPVRAETVWAATTEGTYVSYDAGATWLLANPVLMATDIAIHPADTSSVFAAHGNLGSPGHGLYRSEDGGASWERLAAGLPATYRGKALLSIAPSDPSVLYATIGNGFSSSDGNWLVRSVDGGDTWEIRESATNFVGSQGWYSHDVQVHPSDPDFITVIGFLIYTSSDGGGVLLPATEWNSWTIAAPQVGQHDGASNYTHPDHHALAVHPEDPDYMLFATDGGIYRTTDGARSFRALNGGLQTVQFYAGMSNSARDSEYAMAGTQDNTTLLYRGTVRWRILSGGDGAWTAIDPGRPNRLFWSSQYLAMRRSTDGGINSVSIRPPGNNRFTGFVAPFILSPADADKVYAGRDLVYVSTDQGETWGTGNRGNVLTGEPLVSLAGSHQNRDVAYAITAPGSFDRGRVLITTNGGSDWRDVTGRLPDRYLVDLAVDPTDDSRVFLTVAGFGSDHVFRTSDAGANWEPAGSGLPDLPTWSVAIDPDYPDTVFAGNDVGVFVSENGGDTWGPFDAGLPEAIIAMDLSISTVERKLRVATHGNGMWQRQLDGGENREPELPINQAFEVLTVFPNPSNGITRVTFVLGDAQDAHVGVYNADGRLSLLVHEGRLEAGRSMLPFSTVDLPAGNYFVSVRSAELDATVPLAVVR
ncbi:MAG: T9SS type A sorting domain-containing protein [Rhodothermales bacterium]|nr:T9SS type A sorting domain-containing protein [Rhodothermales bacterium]